MDENEARKYTRFKKIYELFLPIFYFGLYKHPHFLVRLTMLRLLFKLPAWAAIHTTFITICILHLVDELSNEASYLTIFSAYT